ncbi:hypothetical protein DRJ16_02395 [Candidatus Woesearchaeota archaeon]|nr:MAG: hypothetical protein DRJ16_02395 [Candidatus Woesearchaeota archaeon]
MGRGYAKRNYLVVADDNEILRSADVENIVDRILRKIQPRSMVTLNRLLTKEGYSYYTNHAIAKLVKILRKKGLEVKKVSRSRYVILSS